MSNTSTIHVKTDFDCKVYDYGQEIGTTKADTYCDFELRKGEHELTFVYTEDESISKTISYKVDEVCCDYRLIVEIIEIIYKKAIEYDIHKTGLSSIDLLKKAAEKGYVWAQLELGLDYYLMKDESFYVESVKWFSKAAAQGNNVAKYNLGICYEKGRGVSENINQAFVLFSESAEKGFIPAQKKLGHNYMDGIGVKKDSSTAFFWFEKAANQGDAESEYNLGVCYAKGLGVNQDISKATIWFNKAAEHGVNKAQEILDVLNTKKTKSIKYLFFDTETTGVPCDYNAPVSDSNNWPRLVQLSWITTDEDCNILSKNDHIIYPNGFTIPTDAARVHGITTKIAQEKGEPLNEVIEKFNKDYDAAHIIVGHNIDFDKKIIRAELFRLAKKDFILFSTKLTLCTMEAATDYCKIPGYHGYKWPKLQELHKKLFGYEFEDAHNSMSDVTATLKCFKEMRRLELI